MKSIQKKLRLRWLIYPRFQYQLVAFQTGAMIVVCAIVILSTHFAFRSLRDSGIQAGLSQNHAYFKFLDLQARMVYQRIVTGLIVGSVGTAFLSLWLSNRVAGPIVRMRGYFKALGHSGEENASPLRFRKGDFFEDLPDEVNGAVERIQGKAGSTSAAHEDKNPQGRGAA